MKYTFQDVDERIIKTRFALTGAIINLIKRENKIKVLDICHEANITPMTYYHHFNNKTDLLEYTVRKQLETILPIPKKLKPINLKHLLYYLINSLSLFIKNNQQLIRSSLEQIKNNGFEGSYLFLAVRISIDLIKEEIAILLGHNDPHINLVNSIICGSVLNSFFQMIISNKFINPTTVWNTFKSVNVLLN